MNVSSISSLAQTIGADGSANISRTGESDGAAFGNVMAELGASTAAALQKAESASMNALQGKGDTRELVDAIMNAERSLQTALAVRDKLVAAFQEITRMSI